MLEVDDDGVGTTTTDGGLGLGNLEQRAHQLGGELSVSASPLGGTRVRWAVPVG